MAQVIYRGSTPTIRFKPTNDMSVTDLGSPTVGISQELVYISPEVTVNANENYISVTLTEAETLSLVEGVDTTVQEIWVNEDTGDVIRFPVHNITVASSVVEELLEESENQDDVDPEPETPVEPEEETTEEEETPEEVPGTDDPTL